MTIKIEELVKRLRARRGPGFEDGVSPEMAKFLSNPAPKIQIEAADVLEAQAARIKELEARERDGEANDMSLRSDIDDRDSWLKDADSRISTLEAQVKAFREAALQTKKLPGIVGEARRIPISAFDALMSALQMTEPKDVDGDAQWNAALNEAERVVRSVSEKYAKLGEKTGSIQQRERQFARVNALSEARAAIRSLKRP